MAADQRSGETMILTPVARRGPYAVALRWTIPVSFASWLLLAVTPNLGFVASLCLPGDIGALGSLADNLRAQLGLAEPLNWFVEWLFMIGAMMLPLTIPALSFLARGSFAKRRTLLLTLWLAGFLAAWALAAVVASVVILVLRALRNLGNDALVGTRRLCGSSGLASVGCKAFGAGLVPYYAACARFRSRSQC